VIKLIECSKCDSNSPSRSQRAFDVLALYKTLWSRLSRLQASLCANGSTSRACSPRGDGKPHANMDPILNRLIRKVRSTSRDALESDVLLVNTSVQISPPSTPHNRNSPASTKSQALGATGISSSAEPPFADSDCVYYLLFVQISIILLYTVSPS